MIWGYYLSPMMYGQNAIVVNEFLDKRWNKVRSLGFFFLVLFELNRLTNFCVMQPNTDPRINATTVGKVLLKTRGFFTEDHWFWVCVAALFGFSIVFNILFIGALTYLNRKFHLIPFHLNEISIP